MQKSWCYIKTLPFYTSGVRAVSARGKTWDVGDTLDIVFLNGNHKQKTTLKRAVGDIIRHANLRVRFDSVSISKADIKVRFQRGGGNWSYLGTDALFTQSNQPTMNIDNDDYGTILHECFHAIVAGHHEHQSPTSEIEWNREQVIRDLSGPPNYWDLETIEHNVLNRVDKKGAIYTDFDRESIMLYFFPDSWVKNGKGTQRNNVLSDKDIAHIKRIYPKYESKKSFWVRLKEFLG